MSLCELGYFALHLYHILGSWSYNFSILFIHQFLYRFFSPGTKAYLDHEYKIVTMASNRETLFTRLRDLWFLTGLTRPDGLFHFFVHSNSSSDSSSKLTKFKFSNLRAERADTPSAAFLRIIRKVHLLPTSPCLNAFVDEEIQHFWSRGITGASKPDHYLFGGKWYIKDIPDPREKLGNDSLLCAIAASTAEHMVEVFNWRIGLGIRRDLEMLRVRKPYWDKNLVPCVMESAPEWCKDVEPVQVQTVVGRKGGEDTAKRMLESKAIDLSPSFKKRNLLANSQFMYFA